jgi:uncharacterized protein (DUF1015 family)
MRYKFELVPVEKLHEHEAISPDTLRECIQFIKNLDGVNKPILVDDQFYVILDGHHRFNALKMMGCKRIPAYLIDYESHEVMLGLWPEACVTSISKKDVIKMGLSNKVYPPKTTRHTFRFELPKVSVPLKDLM